MVQVESDVSDVDYGGGGEWGGNGWQPKPGIVNAHVVGCTPRKEKKDGTKLAKPDIEWIFAVDRTAGRSEVDEETGAWLAIYTAAPKKDNSWKLANVLEALGIVTETKRVAKWDTDKQLGKPVRLRIRGGKVSGQYAEENPDRADEYRAEISKVLPPGEGAKATKAGASSGIGAGEAPPSEVGDEPPF